MNRQRRMMHEEINWPAFSLVQARAQPCLALLTVETRMAVRTLGIEEKKTTGRRVEDGLNEAEVVDGSLGKYAAEIAAIVMVAHKKPNRHRQNLKRFAQTNVGGPLAMMSEIARDDAKLCICMVLGDIGQAGLQAFARIIVEETIARWNQVKVGDLDDFHLRY